MGHPPGPYLPAAEMLLGWCFGSCRSQLPPHGHTTQPSLPDWGLEEAAQPLGSPSLARSLPRALIPWLSSSWSDHSHSGNAERQWKWHVAKTARFPVPCGVWAHPASGSDGECGLVIFASCFKVVLLFWRTNSPHQGLKAEIMTSARSVRYMARHMVNAE